MLQNKTKTRLLGAMLSADNRRSHGRKVRAREESMLHAHLKPIMETNENAGPTNKMPITIEVMPPSKEPVPPHVHFTEAGPPKDTDADAVHPIVPNPNPFPWKRSLLHPSLNTRSTSRCLPNTGTTGPDRRRRQLTTYYRQAQRSFPSQTNTRRQWSPPKCSSQRTLRCGESGLPISLWTCGPQCDACGSPTGR